MPAINKLHCRWVLFFKGFCKFRERTFTFFKIYMYKCWRTRNFRDLATEIQLVKVTERYKWEKCSDMIQIDIAILFGSCIRFSRDYHLIISRLQHRLLLFLLRRLIILIKYNKLLFCFQIRHCYCSSIMTAIIKILMFIGIIYIQLTSKYSFLI